jgi:hypothetical protein
MRFPLSLTVAGMVSMATVTQAVAIDLPDEILEQIASKTTDVTTFGRFALMDKTRSRLFGRPEIVASMLIATYSDEAASRALSRHVTNIAVIDLIMANDVLQSNSSVADAMDFAASRHRMDLIDKWAQRYGYPAEAYILAAETNQLNLVRHLVSRHVPDERSRSQMLICAAECGHKDMVEFMFQFFDGDEFAVVLALEGAASENHVEIVRFLVENMPEIGPMTLEQAIKDAARNGHEEATSYLLSLLEQMQDGPGAVQVERAISDAYANAAGEGHMEIMELLFASTLRSDTITTGMWVDIVKSGRRPPLELLYRHYPLNPTTFSQEQLSMAYRETAFMFGSIKGLRYLTDVINYVPTRSDQGFVLKRAIESNLPRMWEFVLASRSSIISERWWRYALLHAHELGRRDAITHLLTASTTRHYQLSPDLASILFGGCGQ